MPPNIINPLAKGKSIFLSGKDIVFWVDVGESTEFVEAVEK
jgi:hypothetical protein